MTRLMEWVNIFQQVVQYTKDNGTQINDMEKVNRNGQMELLSKAHTLRTKRMAQENLNGQMGISMQDNLGTTEKMDLD